MVRGTLLGHRHTQTNNRDIRFEKEKIKGSAYYVFLHVRRRFNCPKSSIFSAQQSLKICLCSCESVGDRIICFKPLLKGSGSLNILIFPAHWIRCQIVAGQLIGGSPATVTFAGLFTSSAGAFYCVSIIF